MTSARLEVFVCIVSIGEEVGSSAGSVVVLCIMGVEVAGIAGPSGGLIFRGAVKRSGALFA